MVDPVHMKSTPSAVRDTVRLTNEQNPKCGIVRKCTLSKAETQTACSQIPEEGLDFDDLFDDDLIDELDFNSLLDGDHPRPQYPEPSIPSALLSKKLRSSIPAYLVTLPAPRKIHTYALPSPLP